MKKFRLTVTTMLAAALMASCSQRSTDTGVRDIGSASGNYTASQDMRICVDKNHQRVEEHYCSAAQNTQPAQNPQAWNSQQPTQGSVLSDPFFWLYINRGMSYPWIGGFSSYGYYNPYYSHSYGYAPSYRTPSSQFRGNDFGGSRNSGTVSRGGFGSSSGSGSGSIARGRSVGG